MLLIANHEFKWSIRAKEPPHPRPPPVTFPVVPS